MYLNYAASNCDGCRTLICRATQTGAEICSPLFAAVTVHKRNEPNTGHCSDLNRRPRIDVVCKKTLTDVGMVTKGLIDHQTSPPV